MVTKRRDDALGPSQRKRCALLRSKARRVSYPILATATLIAVLAGCSSGSSGGGGGNASSGTVTIGWEGGSGDPITVTVAKNYFARDMHQNVSLKLFASGPAALAAIASGSLQYMCGIGIPPTISAMAKGVPMQVVWNQERYTGNAGLVAKKGSGITSMADMKGKTLAIVIGSQSTFELTAYLKNSGVSLGDIHQLNMSPQQMQSAWSQGTIDAALTWSPVYNYLLAHGGTVIKSDADLPPTQSSYNICIASKSYAASHKQITMDFVKALADGVTYTQNHRQSALQLMAKEAGTNVQTATEELAGYKVFTLSDQTTPAVMGSGSQIASSATAQSLVNNWAALHEAGFQPMAPPSSVVQYVNPTYAAAAQKGS